MQAVGVAVLVGVGLASWRWGHWAGNGQVSANIPVTAESASPEVANVEVDKDVFNRGDEGDLRKWLDQWLNRQMAGQSTNDIQRAELSDLLASTSLPCERLVELGEVYYKLSRDRATTAIFFCCAISHGDQELTDVKNLDDQARLTVKRMKQCEPLLWEVVGTEEKDCIQSLLLLSQDIDRHVDPNDEDLGWAVPWAQIGEAECLWKQHKTAEAIAVCEKLDPRGKPIEVQMGIAWIRALSYIQAQRYADALPNLELCVNDGQFKYYEDSLRDLVETLAALDRVDEAKHWLVVWQQHYASQKTKGMEQDLYSKIAAAEWRSEFSRK